MPGVCATIIIVGQLHVEAHVIRQRTQVLHQGVELPHQQDARLLGVATRQRRQLVVVVIVAAGAERKGGGINTNLLTQVFYQGTRVL